MTSKHILILALSIIAAIVAFKFIESLKEIQIERIKSSRTFEFPDVTETIKIAE